jgi:hypothetical protein
MSNGPNSIQLYPALSSSIQLYPEGPIFIKNGTWDRDFISVAIVPRDLLQNEAIL